MLLFRSGKRNLKRNSSSVSNGKLQKTENFPKTIDNEIETAENGKVEKVDTDKGAEEEINNVHKMVNECNYDEIKVIQENIVTIDEKVETRF